MIMDYVVDESIKKVQDHNNNQDIALNTRAHG